MATWEAHEILNYQNRVLRKIYGL